MPSDPRVNDLLAEMLESGLTPEEVCRDCPELLPEVRARWKQFGPLDAEIEALFPAPGVAPGARAAPGAGELPTIPGYDVEAVLGRGGVGVVYRARHLRLNRPVALKMLLAGPFARPQERGRFLREAEALAGLRHPNVVPVFDSGELDGRPYFTMEYVEGGTLARKLSGTPLPARDAAGLVATLANAVQAAHAAGIVHRDLKPGNVLLTADGTPKVSDFGLARRVDGGPGLTRTGAAVGTPSYMAPEQARGETGVGPAADVYSLGAVLYECLTGRPPFKAESTLETLQQLATREPVPPSRLNAKVPRDLETVCLKCLHKDPRRRYTSARELAEDLGRFLDHRPVRARPVGPAERALKWARRRPGAAVALLSGMLVTVGMLAGGWWYLADRTAAARAVAATEQAAEQDLREASEALERSDRPAARTALERANARLGNRGPADLRGRLDRAAHDLELAERLDAIPLRRAASGVRMASTVGNGPDGSAREYEAGTGFDMNQSDRDYRAVFEEGGLGTIDEPPEKVADRVRGTRVRSVILTGLDDWASCVDGDRRRWVLEVARRADDGPKSAWQQRARDPDVWKDPVALAELARTGPLDTRFVPLQLTLARRVTTLGGDGVVLLRRVQAAHPNDFWAAFWLGVVLAARSDPAAVVYVRVALAVRPEAVAAYLLLGNLLENEGRLDEAAEQYQHALGLDPANDTAHYNLARTLLFRGLPGPAAEHCREVIRLFPRWGPAHFLLGHALLELGRFDEARPAFALALELLPPEVPPTRLARDYLLRCDRMRTLEGRLPGIARGDDKPVTAAEGIDFAELCARKGRYAAAARLYALAFTGPKPAEEFLSGHRYRAACAAALAGSGQGEDSAALDGPARAALREQALVWLRADRNALAVRHLEGDLPDRKLAVWQLRLLLQDTALAGVRDKPALAANERRQWEALWGSVENVVAGGPVATLPKARAYAARGEWAVATDCYAWVLRTPPTDDSEAWFEFAAASLLAENRKVYRQTRAWMLYRAPGARGEMRPYHVARAWTLAPGPESDVARPETLSAGELRSSGKTFWSLTEQGALLHRAGKFREAIPLFNQSLAADTHPGRQVLNWLWLALSYQRLDEPDEARRWLDKATRWLDQFGGEMPANADALGLHLHNWLEARVLRHEAEALIVPGSPPPEKR